MFKKTKQRQKQRQKQAQVVNINIGTTKPVRKTRSSKGSGGKGNTPPPPPPQPPMGYVSYSPPLHQMNRLIPSAQIQPYGQKTLHQLGVNRNEQGTQAGVSVPAWWNNQQENEYGRPINLLDNLSSVSKKSVNSISIQDDIDDIVQSERSLEIQHSYPSSASYASSSPASLASYPTDVINGSQQGDEEVSAQAASSGVDEIRELSVAEQKEEAVPVGSNVNEVLMSNARQNQQREEFVRRQNEIIRRRREEEAEYKAEQKALTERLIADGVLPRRRGKGKKNKQ
jgi:hypothetical protein